MALQSGLQNFVSVYAGVTLEDEVFVGPPPLREPESLAAVLKELRAGAARQVQ